MYRASRDGYEATDFHRICDGKGPLLFVLKTDNGLIGGFVPD